MSNDERYATLTPIGSESDAISVHFNPASLEYTVTNTLQEQQGGQNGGSKGKGQRKQYTTQSTAKLTMDLIFDTTHTGEDVRIYTGKIASFMQPKGSDQNAVPPVVEFAWGSYFFKGMIESFKETIDFFHSDGVPLRSNVNLVMSAQDKVFEASGGTAADNAPVEPTQVPFSKGQNPTSLAKKAGNPRAGGAIAAANKQETMRFSTGPLTVSASVPLKGPSAFASAGGSAGVSAQGGAGLGIKGGAGLSVGGFGVNGGAGISLNGKKIAGINVVSRGGAVTASAGISVPNNAGFSTSFGSKSSAGVSASAGAFAGIGASASASASFKLDTSKLLPKNDIAGLSTGASASFGIGGAAGGGALADVKGDAKIRIIFTEG